MLLLYSLYWGALIAPFKELLLYSLYWVALIAPFRVLLLYSMIKSITLSPFGCHVGCILGTPYRVLLLYSHRGFCRIKTWRCWGRKLDPIATGVATAQGFNWGWEDGHLPQHSWGAWSISLLYFTLQLL